VTVLPGSTMRNIVGERPYRKARPGGHVARGNKWRFVWVGAWPVTVFSLLIGDLLRCSDTLSSVHSRRYEIYV
jgi:hypothetical protein